MKVEITAKALRHIIGRVAPLIERRNTIPILNNVKLDTSGRVLIAQATNMDAWAWAFTEEANIIEPGAAFLSAHTITGMLTGLPNDTEITIATDDEKTTVKVVAGEISLEWSEPAHKADEFPEAPSVLDGATGFKVKADDFRALLERVRFAISDEETRYYLNGIFLQEKGEHVLAVATDGHRLARFRQHANGLAGMLPPGGIIIPRFAIPHIMANLSAPAANKPVSVSCNETHVAVLVADEFHLITKLVDGTFLDYERVIPDTKNLCSRARFNKARLAHTLRLVNRVAHRQSAVELEFEPNAVNLRSYTGAHERVHARVPALCGGPTSGVGFNGRYFIDAVKHIEGELVDVLVSGPAEPSILAAPGDDPDFITVLMPMRY